jgi:hypothetical protein
MNNITDFLPEDIPELLKTSNEEVIFKEGIDIRDKFHKFYKKNIEKVILDYIPSTLYDIEKYNSSVTFVAGSRAWEQYFSKQCQDNLKLEELSLLEKNSILPGNYDIFCICTDKTQIDEIYKKFCISIDKIMEKLNDNKSVSSTYSLTYISNVGKEVNETNKQKISSHKFYAKHLEKYCPINTNFSEDGCVFPACKAMHLELTFDPLNKKKTHKDTLFNEKVILYFEVIYLEEPNALSIINKDLISTCVGDMKYLNLTGLYLFSELILKRSKEYDVDLYRRRILEKLLVRYHIDPEKMYIKILKLYKILFSSRTDYKLKLGVLLKNFLELKKPDIINEFSANVTEAFRVFINSFVIQVDNTFTDKTQNYIFVTGGDAYRRYLEEIKRTNDIDTKVIYSKSKDKSILIESLTYYLSELIAGLYKNKVSILKHLESKHDLSEDNIKLEVQFKPIYTKEDGKSSTGQFRLRFIEKGNLTLFSIDYRSKIRIYLSVGELDIDITLNHDLPILDLVLAKSDMKYSFAVEISNGLPVASSQYLQKDLRDIYAEINQNLKLRFHKSSKDRQRFISLVNYLKKAKELLETHRNLELKRKIEDFLSDISDEDIKYKKRKEEEDVDMEDTNMSVDEYTEDDFMDIEYTGEGYHFTIDIANFKNYPILSKHTLDKRFFSEHYRNSFKKDKDIIFNYTTKLINLMKINDKLPEDEKEEKLQLSFDDIQELYDKKEKNMDESLDLFSKLSL